MNASASVLACGIVEDAGLAGSGMRSMSWPELDELAPGSRKGLGSGKLIKALFGRSDDKFRRIDMPGRALVLATAAAAIDDVLTIDQRRTTGICVETDIGSLRTDVDFQASLADEFVHAGIFPYSLTNTCLGEVALRHQLHGPTIAMSVRDGGRGESLREALRMLAAGEVEHVLVGSVDALLEPTCGREPTARAVVALLARSGDGLGTIDWPAIDGSAADDDPFLPFAAMCR